MADLNYRRIAPDDSFIGRYLQHNANTETSIEYDFWGSLWLMSTALGRNLIVDRPSAPVYMNLYVIFVADSGVTRKSTAVRTAAAIASTFVSQLPDDQQPEVIEGKCTAERLDERLHERSETTGQASACISISELAVFLGTERYTNNVPGLLTDLYDCPQSRRSGGTLKRGAVIQHNVFVNFLSASTPAWLLKSVNPTVVQGGFTSRCMFVVSERPKSKIAWPTTDGAVVERTKRLLSDMHTMRYRASDYKFVTLNEGAMNTFERWYARRVVSVDDYNASFESRQDAHVLRVAAMLCINDDSWVVQHTHVQTAIRIIDDIKSGGSKLFSGGQERNRYILGVEAVRMALIQSGLDPMPRSKLFLRARYYVDFAEFSAILDVMHEMGAIQRFEMKLNNFGRAVELIRATKLLTVKDASQHVLERIVPT